MVSRCLPPPLFLVLVLCCVSLPSALPNPQIGPDGLSLPGGLPLDIVLSHCGEQGVYSSIDIGPCLANLLRGVIDATRANFTTGIRLTNDKVLKLDPLKIKDIRRQKKHGFELGISDILIHGIRNVHIGGITFTEKNISIDMSFNRLFVTGNLGLKYLFITVHPNVSIDLDNLRARLTATWSMQSVDNRLDLLLNDALVSLELGNFVVDVLNLGRFGTFVEQVVNRHSDIAIELIMPNIARSVTKIVNTKLQTVKLANHNEGRFSYE